MNDYGAAVQHMSFCLNRQNLEGLLKLCEDAEVLQFSATIFSSGMVKIGLVPINSFMTKSFIPFDNREGVC